MLKARLTLILLFVACFSLATCLQPRQVAREVAAGRSGSVLALLLGSGRAMFANEFFAKADAYFHRGNYPSIFDLNARREENHMTEEAADREHVHGEAEHDEHDESPPPRDWIERFGRHFSPTLHVHLRGNEEREMLPWLSISAALDPHRVETYVVTAYWLGDRLGKVDEAERFLREGLRANPKNTELLNELGRLYYLHRRDLSRAHNVWSAALRRWREVEEPKKEPNKLLLEEILGGLFQIEMREDHFDRAIEYLRQLKKVSPNPEGIQRQMDEIANKHPTPGQTSDQ
jgi:tetratricopeptide (TPR) repeat protein